MKIDLYNHVMPRRYLELMQQHSQDQGIIKRMSSLRLLWDIEARAQMLERAGRCWGLWSNSSTMAWIIYLPLEPGELLYACQTSARYVQR
jgi:hypothetical protein